MDVKPSVAPLQFLVVEGQGQARSGSIYTVWGGITTREETASNAHYLAGSLSPFFIVFKPLDPTTPEASILFF